MLCSKCGAENPAEARFCGKCGTAATNRPAVSQVSAPAENPVAPPPLPKKSRLTPPIILAGALVVLLGLGGLIALVHFSGSAPSRTDDSADSAPASTTMPSLGFPPSPSKFGNGPALNAAANQAQPTQFTEVSDELYTQKIIGSWTGKKMMSGALVETLAIYSPGGHGNWTGTVTYLGQQTYFTIQVSWGVKNGTFYSRVDASTIPQLMPVGFTTESKIISVSDTEWTYVDALDQTTQTIMRVRGNQIRHIKG